VAGALDRTLPEHEPMKSGTVTVRNNLEAVVASMMQLTKIEVLVGIPAPKTDRKDEDGITNAELGYIHEHGAPEVNIPSRPFLRPGIVDARQKIEKYFRQAGDAAFASDHERMLRAFSAAGQSAASAAQARIRAGIPPPLKASTVAHRRKRSKGSKYRRVATRPSQVTPLIDTGQLLRSITYVLRKQTHRGQGRFA